MNFLKKIHELLRQKEQIVRKSQKHDANLQKNSTLYFQIGLIICLLTTNALFEMYFETNIPEPYVHEGLGEEIFTLVPVIEKPHVLIAKAEPKIVIKPRRLVKPPIIKKNDYVKPKEEVPALEAPSIETPLVKVNPTVVPLKKKYNSMNVEEVPIFPDCEGVEGNEARIKCMSDKLSKIVQRRFDGDKAVDHGLRGKQRISVQFTIDKTGNVTDIKARAPHPSLEKEAKRVMTKVPKMQPGKQSKIPVDVVYSLPIIFQVQN